MVIIYWYIYITNIYNIVFIILQGEYEKAIPYFKKELKYWLCERDRRIIHERLGNSYFETVYRIIFNIYYNNRTDLKMQLKIIKLH